MIAEERILEFRNELRKESLYKRDSLSAEWRASASEEIVRRLDGYLAVRNVRALHCYLNFRSEVETRDLIGTALSHGVQVIVPVIERIEQTPESESNRERLAHVEIHRLSGLVKGRFGIEEPSVRTAASLESLDAVIVPVVAFDRSGTRLGYGKGFYDIFLRELPSSVERIGLAFSTQEVEHIPLLAHDERLDAIVTEQEIIQARRNAAA